MVWNGILCYGVCVQDPPWAYYDEFYDDNPRYSGILEPFEEWLAHKNGITPPESDNDKEWQKYFRKARQLIKTCPVEDVLHCSFDNPQYFLAVRGAVNTSHFGGVTQVKLAEVDSKELIAFCKKYKIKYKGKPSWMLSSFFGY